jgi:hypothetical protein
MALRSKDQGRQNVGGVSRGNGAQRNDLGERNPEPPTAAKRKQACYATFLAFFKLSFNNIIPNIVITIPIISNHNG